MKITNQAISVAQRWDRLFAQSQETKRELQYQHRHRNPDPQRITPLERKAARVGRDAAKVSTRLRKLMDWE